MTSPVQFVRIRSERAETVRAVLASAGLRVIEIDGTGASVNEAIIAELARCIGEEVSSKAVWRCVVSDAGGAQAYVLLFNHDGLTRLGGGLEALADELQSGEASALVAGSPPLQRKLRKELTLLGECSRPE